MKRDLPAFLLTATAMVWVLFLALVYEANQKPKDQLAEFCKKDSNWVMYARICP